MEKLEIKYLCKKGITPKEIHEDFMETLGKESPFYSTVKKWAAEFKREKERVLRMMDSLAAPKMPRLLKMSLSCTPWLCVMRSIAREVGIRFGAVQSTLTDILGLSMVSTRWVPCPYDWLVTF